MFKIDPEEKVYYAVVTGSMTDEELEKLGVRKGYIKLSVPTDNNVDNSLVKKRPFIGTRDDYGDKEYSDMSFSSNDIYIILKVQNNNPIHGSNYKKRKKRLRNGATQ